MTTDPTTTDLTFEDLVQAYVEDRSLPIDDQFSPFSVHDLEKGLRRITATLAMVETETELALPLKTLRMLVSCEIVRREEIDR